jgi:hypothetical protein
LNERQLSLNIPNRWFEKRRDFFVRQVVDDFFAVTHAFQDTYLVYLECRTPGSLACSDLLDEPAVEKRRQLWDQLVRMVGTENEKGPLWLLKDQCHMVWPEIDHEQDVSGSLFDWLIGSIFHETMKLKENIYLLNRYGPAASRIKDRSFDVGHSSQSDALPSPASRMGNIIDVHGLINRAAVDAVSQMEQIAFLFSHASYMLRLKMTALSGNSLIVRLLVEQEEMVRLLWGEEIEDIFIDMFFGDAAEGFCTAGRSYLNGQWFTQALKMYQRALDANPTCDEALVKMVQLQAVVTENRELLGVA